MYYKLDKDSLVSIKMAEKLTNTDYERVDDLMPVDSFVSMVDELLTEIEKLQEKVEELEYDIDNNYELKRINPYEEYGVRECDFL